MLASFYIANHDNLITWVLLHAPPISYTEKNAVYRNTPGEQYFHVSMVTILFPRKQEYIAPLGRTVTLHFLQCSLSLPFLIAFALDLIITHAMYVCSKVSINKVIRCVRNTDSSKK